MPGEHWQGRAARVSKLMGTLEYWRRGCQSVLLWALLLLAGLLCPAGTMAQALVADGGFEQMGRDPSAAAWIARGAGAEIRQGVGRVSPDDAEAAAYAAALAPKDDFSTEWVQPLLPLAPGREYVLSAWVKLDGAAAQALLGVRSSRSFPRIYRGLAGEGWQHMELAFTAEEGWAQVVLSSTAGATVLWDDVALHESSSEVERLAAIWEERLRQGNPLYTGLVVDSRGSGLRRGMSPKIYDVTGRLVFAGAEASFDQLIRKGLVAYVKTLEEATSHPRLAVSTEYPMRLPLVVDAQDTTGPTRTAVVVGLEDASRIQAATDQYDFLGRFAIVFVVD